MSQIKILQPKEGVTLLAVKVPDDAGKLLVKGVRLCYDDNVSAWWPHIELPEGNWRILGKSTKIAEEVWEVIVEHRWDYYKNYLAPEDGNVGNYKRLVCNTATQSAMSLLTKHEVYSVNPYGEKPKSSGEYHGKGYREWQQAEENTGPYLILIKQ